MFNLCSGKQLLLSAVAVGFFAGASNADVIMMQQGGTGSVTNTPVDTTYIAANDASSTSLSTQNGDSKISANASFDRQYGLIGVEDMFNLLPKTLPGETLQINSATLTVTTYSTDGGGGVTFYLVTTNWLLGAAGTNDTTVTGAHPDGAAATKNWADGTSFSTTNANPLLNDINETLTATGTLSNTYHASSTVDVTNLVQAMYAGDTNYGFALQGVGSGLSLKGSGNGTVAYNPVLTINYDYVPSAVPEPASLLLLGIGGMALGLKRRRSIAA